VYGGFVFQDDDPEDSSSELFHHSPEPPAIVLLALHLYGVFYDPDALLLFFKTSSSKYLVNPYLVFTA